MSVNGVSPSLAAPIAYDRSGGHARSGDSRTAAPARSGEAMRIEITPQARARAAEASVAAANTDAAASAAFFASPAGAEVLGKLLPSAPQALRL